MVLLNLLSQKANRIFFEIQGPFNVTARNVPNILLSSLRHPVCQPICFTVTIPSFVDKIMLSVFDLSLLVPKYGRAKYKFPSGIDTSPYDCSVLPATERQNLRVEELLVDAVVSMQYPAFNTSILSNPPFRRAQGAWFIL
jgi:hypothetical protein